MEVCSYIIGIAATILGNSFKIIPTGYTGVRTTFGQINATVATKGWNWKIPFIEKIALVNNKQQDFTIDSKIWGETKEKTPVYATGIVITCQINENSSAWLYANVTNLKSIIDDKLVASALKSAMVELTVETVTNRSYVEPLLVDKLQMAVNEKYSENAIIIKNTVINNMDFEESYNQADAESKRITAEADAQAALTRAEAEAEANRKLSESLTEAIIKNKTMD